MSAYDSILAKYSGEPSASTRPTPPPISGSGGRYDAIVDRYAATGGPESPGIVSRGVHAVGSVLGAPKSLIDAAARTGARFQGMNVPDDMTTGRMLRQAAGLTPEQGDGTQGYAGSLGGKALEFGADLATDPVTWAMGGVPAGLGGKALARTGASIAEALPGALGRAAAAELPAAVRKGAGVAFTGLMGAGAYQEGGQALETYKHEGFSPLAAEEALGTALSAGGAGLGLAHMAAGRRANRAEIADAARRAGPPPSKPVDPWAMPASGSGVPGAVPIPDVPLGRVRADVPADVLEPTPAVGSGVPEAIRFPGVPLDVLRADAAAVPQRSGSGVPSPVPIPDIPLERQNVEIPEGMLEADPRSGSLDAGLPDMPVPEPRLRLVRPPDEVQRSLTLDGSPITEASGTPWSVPRGLIPDEPTRPMAESRGAPTVPEAPAKPPAEPVNVEVAPTGQILFEAWKAESDPAKAAKLLEDYIVQARIGREGERLAPGEGLSDGQVFAELKRNGIPSKYARQALDAVSKAHGIETAKERLARIKAGADALKAKEPKPTETPEAMLERMASEGRPEAEILKTVKMPFWRIRQALNMREKASAEAKQAPVVSEEGAPDLVQQRIDDLKSRTTAKEVGNDLETIEAGRSAVETRPGSDRAGLAGNTSGAAIEGGAGRVEARAATEKRTEDEGGSTPAIIPPVKPGDGGGAAPAVAPEPVWNAPVSAEGREADGPLFQQENVAAAKADAARQKTLTDRPAKISPEAAQRIRDAGFEVDPSSVESERFATKPREPSPESERVLQATGREALTPKEREQATRDVESTQRLDRTLGRDRFAAGEEKPPAKPITREHVEMSMPGLAFEEKPDGSFEARLKDGRTLRVSPVAAIEISEASRQRLAESAAASGIEGSVEPAARYSRDDVANIAKIELKQGGPASTAPHEFFHLMMDLALTAKEKAAVLAKYGDEESAAYAYQDWTPAKGVNSWFSKIVSYARRMYRTFKPTWESTFEDVRAGRASERIRAEEQAKGDVALRSTETASTIAPNENLQQVSGTESSREEPLLSSLSRGVHAGLEENASTQGPSKGEGHSATLRESLQTTGETETGTVPKVRESEQSNAPRGLLETPERGLAVPEVPSGAPRGGVKTERFATAATALRTAARETPKAEKKVGLGDQILEGWTANLVGGPPTQVANVAGNTGELGARAGETVAGGIADRLISRLTGTERTRHDGEVRAELAAAYRRAPQAFDRFSQSIKDALTLAPETETEVAVHQKEGRTAGAIPGKFGRGVRIPFRLLEAADGFFKDVGGDAELGKLSFRQASNELPRGTKAEIRARAQEIFTEASDDTGRRANLREKVEQSRLDRTYQNDPGKLVNSVIKLRSDHPWMRVVIPFIRVPANVAQLTIQRTPIGLYKAFGKFKEYKSALAEGAAPEKLTRLREEAVDALARPLFGMSVMAGFGMAAQAGAMTGGGPVDERAKNQKRETGWQPYSFVVNVDGKKVYIPFNRFEPVSSLLGFVADMSEAGDSKDAGDIFEKALGSIGQNLTNKTYLQGLSDAASFLARPKEFAKQYVSNMAGSVVPNIVASAARGLDPVVRDTSSTPGLGGIGAKAVNVVKSRIPGVSQTLPERISGTGETVERPGNAFTRAFLPSQPSREKPERELEGFLSGIGYTPSEPPRDLRMPSKPGQVAVKAKLTDDEYGVMVEARKKASDRLRRSLDSPGFRRLQPEEQIKYIRKTYDDAGDLARERILPRVVRRVRAEAQP